MRYEKNARCKFFKKGRTIYGTIIGRVMEGRKTICIHVVDDQNKIWKVDSAKDLEKA